MDKQYSGIQPCSNIGACSIMENAQGEEKGPDQCSEHQAVEVCLPTLPFFSRISSYKLPKKILYGKWFRGLPSS